VGVAFAADVGAEIIGMTSILSGTSVDTDPVSAGGWPGGLRRARVSASGQNEEGTFGAWFRFETYGFHKEVQPWDSGLTYLEGYAWWKPVDQIKLTLGRNGDGWLGKDGVTGWGFYQVAGDTDVVHEGWKFTDNGGVSFYGGWGSGGNGGALLEVTPFEPLTVSFAIPFADGDEAKNVYRKLHAQAVYNLGSIGEVALTYRGGLNVDAATASKLWAYFGIKAIDNLGIDLGVGYSIPVKDDAGNTYKNPVALGLGVNFGAGALGIKARVQGQFAGSDTVVGGSPIKRNTVVDADLMPFFAITDIVTAHLSTGLQLDKPDGGDATVNWHIEPYVTVKSSWWAPNFYAGFRFQGTNPGVGDSSVAWSIPLGIVVAF